MKMFAYQKKFLNVNYDQSAFSKTKIILQKTFKCKLATLIWPFVAVYGIYIVRNVLTKFISKRKSMKHFTEHRLCFIIVLIKCLLDKKYNVPLTL